MANDTVTYSRKNVETVLDLLDNVQVKGINNIGILARVFAVLNQPIPESNTVEQTGEQT